MGITATLTFVVMPQVEEGDEVRFRFSPAPGVRLRPDGDRNSKRPEGRRRAT